jgi:radical SAM superfamily enzyme YgiQ (UPF0313 family)
MNVLLINSFFMPLNELRELLGNTSDLRRPFFTWPLALLSLAAYARARNPDHVFRIIDANKELHAFFERPDRWRADIRDFMLQMLDRVDIVPEIVGISVNISTGHSSSLLMADIVKEKWPKATVVAGGVHVTNYSRNILEHPSIDYIIRGAAERSFSDFLSHLREQEDPSGIPGVVAPEGDLSSVALPVASFDEIPMLAYDLVDADYYAVKGSRNPSKREDTRSVSYQFSRGCCFNCTFCVGSTVHGKKVTRRSNDLILDELRHLKERYRINTIIVEDDLFGLDKPALYDLCNRMKQSGLGLRFTFPNALSVAVTDEPMIDALIEMGLDAAILAIESGSPYVQKHIIRKNCDLTKALRLARYMRSKGRPVMAYFIIGFPRETVEMMRQTIAYAKQMELDWAYFFVACPLMGSQMTNELFDAGVLNEEKMVEIMDNTRFSKRLYDTPEISAPDLEALAYDANIEINFFNNCNMLHGNYDRAIKWFSDIIDSYHFHIVALACRARCFHATGMFEPARNDIRHVKALIANHPESKRLYERYQMQILALLKGLAGLELHEMPTGRPH